MAKLPETPFLTKDFTHGSRGIDFLGMRWVNYNIMARHLITGINNVSSEIGIYLTGAWIPWKFLKIVTATGRGLSTVDYRRFREKVEIIQSHAVRSNAQANQKFGYPARRIGVEQNYSEKDFTSFDDIGRNTSIYDQANYGPSLNYTSLLKGKALTSDHRVTSIHVAGDDPRLLAALDWLDNSLSKSAAYNKLVSLNPEKFSENEIDDLAENGLHICSLRHSEPNIRQGLAELFFPEDSPRTRTARLIQYTLSVCGEANADELRKMWHTAKLVDGFVIDFPENVSGQRHAWQIFHDRQIQRYFTESFLSCFERCIAREEWDNMPDIVAGLYTVTTDVFGGEVKTFANIIDAELARAGFDGSGGAEMWCDTVTQEHPSYDYVAYQKKVHACAFALASMARWYVRTSVPYNKEVVALAGLGGADRISINFMRRWIEQRINLPIEDFIRDVLSDLVFNQHMRIALSRNRSGEGQKLRLSLVDDGRIAPTPNAGKFGKNDPPWMDDRLNTLLNLMADLDVVGRPKRKGYYCVA